MPWIQLRVTTTEEKAEQVSDMLMGWGAQAVSFLDAHDTPIYEPMPGEVIYWTNTVVVGLFDAEHPMDKVLKQLEQVSFFKGQPDYKLEQLEDKDWEREWMDNFHPIKFGQRLWVCPSWREIPDPTAVNVMLDPGLAFGTGTHPTTSLCMQWLDAIIQPEQTVVDFGCGSGILGIAALKLGAKRVIGVDIDPQAIEASLANAKRNNVEGQIELYLPKDQPADFKADVVVANILAGPLAELKQVISAYVKPGGKLALSGILASQAQSVIDAYSDEFSFDPIVLQDEWVRLSANKQH
ncbi:MAG: 50S ribosomal protein L11 methyltransferase [Gammaproteobacteria bacterium]|nr:50S ribosomal protein L11 methyltransferase [Gammaproteobacteria bacterium]MBU1555652.1 50S ribosomal protein L11 methyltransferase [Gammaproteobacteria bacterium]MBU2068722.1 50S ribosomal protein L11 methyltransferase [Gammaproteobacteria bacterium]MBU2185169.1 50S ribosomal protein L11 methyltransferase [Gammaproteobacteria bacterium]MBU2205401.1 50S ribosomal protein L11 methyltransferase [Gammaproteobacteria bacterium]